LAKRGRDWEKHQETRKPDEEKRGKSGEKRNVLIRENAQKGGRGKPRDPEDDSLPVKTTAPFRGRGGGEIEALCTKERRGPTCWTWEEQPAALGTFDYQQRKKLKGEGTGRRRGAARLKIALTHKSDGRSKYGGDQAVCAEEKAGRAERGNCADASGA